MNKPLRFRRGETGLQAVRDINTNKGGHVESYAEADFVARNSVVRKIWGDADRRF